MIVQTREVIFSHENFVPRVNLNFFHFLLPEDLVSGKSSFLLTKIIYQVEKARQDI